MKDNTTLGEVKAKCVEMTAQYGDRCCEHCDFGELGCCDAPEYWQVEAQPDMKAQPNWEEMFKASEETCRQLYMKLEDAERRANRMAEEIGHLRTIETKEKTKKEKKKDERQKKKHKPVKASTRSSSRLTTRNTICVCSR